VIEDLSRGSPLAVIESAGRSTYMRPTKIGQRVEVDLFGLRPPDGATLTAVNVALGTVVGLAPGTITVRLDARPGLDAEVTVGPARLIALC
jgi:hypothetical protein